jgi:hypothetical protein
MSESGQKAKFRADQRRSALARGVVFFWLNLFPNPRTYLGWGILGPSFDGADLTIIFRSVGAVFHPGGGPPRSMQPLSVENPVLPRAGFSLFIDDKGARHLLFVVNETVFWPG